MNIATGEVKNMSSDEKKDTWAEEYRAMTALNNELAKTQLEHIKNVEARAQLEHVQAVAINVNSLRDNDLAARREWQRHCVAVALVQGLLADSNTIKDDYARAKRAYDLAELMMQEREARK